MSDHKLSAAGYGSKAGDAEQRASRADGFEQGDGRQAATRRTVGVYERPARRTTWPLPLLIMLILAALVSVVATARFLF